MVAPKAVELRENAERLYLGFIEPAGLFQIAL